MENDECVLHVICAAEHSEHLAQQQCCAGCRAVQAVFAWVPRYAVDGHTVLSSMDRAHRLMDGMLQEVPGNSNMCITRYIMHLFQQ